MNGAFLQQLPTWLAIKVIHNVTLTVDVGMEEPNCWQIQTNSNTDDKSGPIMGSLSCSRRLGHRLWGHWGTKRSTLDHRTATSGAMLPPVTAADDPPQSELWVCVVSLWVCRVSSPSEDQVLLACLCCWFRCGWGRHSVDGFLSVNKSGWKEVFLHFKQEK